MCIDIYIYTYIYIYIYLVCGAFVVECFISCLLFFLLLLLGEGRGLLLIAG